MCYPKYIQDAMKDGFNYECSCGELYATPEGAWHCKKCLKYLPSGVIRQALDLRTRQIVERTRSTMERTRSTMERMVGTVDATSMFHAKGSK